VKAESSKKSKTNAGKKDNVNKEDNDEIKNSDQSDIEIEGDPKKKYGLETMLKTRMFKYVPPGLKQQTKGGKGPIRAEMLSGKLSVSITKRELPNPNDLLKASRIAGASFSMPSISFMAVSVK
jgi:hypothetical protein